MKKKKPNGQKKKQQNELKKKRKNRSKKRKSTNKKRPNGNSRRCRKQTNARSVKKSEQNEPVAISGVGRLIAARLYPKPLARPSVRSAQAVPMSTRAAGVRRRPRGVGRARARPVRWRQGRCSSAAVLELGACLTPSMFGSLASPARALSRSPALAPRSARTSSSARASGSTPRRLASCSSRSWEACGKRTVRSLVAIAQSVEEASTRIELV